MILAFFMCFNNMVMPVSAEGESVPEITEEPTAEIVQEEAYSEEETPVETESVIEEQEEESSSETEPVPEIETYEEPVEDENSAEQELQSIEEPSAEVSEEEPVEESEPEQEDAEETILFAGETDPSQFTTVDNADGTVSIKMYSGTDTAVVIPSTIDGKTVTAISDYAFNGNSTIISVEIPGSVKSIGRQAFENDSKLETVTLHEGLTTIANMAFSSCASLKNINLPDTLTTMDGSIFRECTSLENISLPAGLTEIGQSAFLGCTSLNRVVIPNGVTQISLFLFQNCTSLTEVSIPDSVISIGQDAFKNCSSLAKINIPSSVKSISGFSGCTSLKTAGPVGSGKNIEIEYTDTFSDMYMTSGLFANLTEITIGNNVKTIAQNAFKRCPLTNIVIPDSVTKIGNQAFFESTNLTKVIVPGSVTSMGNQAFYNCTGLKTAGPIGSGANIEFGWTQELPYGAFYYANYLTSVTIPDGIKTIGRAAFLNCHNLVSVSIPDSVTTISDNAFDTCKSLTDISIPDSVTNLSQRVFQNCEKLVNVRMPQNISKLGQYTFSGCSSLKSIVVPEGVTEIDQNAFYKCTSLTDVSLPDSLNHMYASVFAECTSLETLEFPKSMSEGFAGYTFQNCTNLKKVVWPLDFTYIPVQTFQNCVSLTDINLSHIKTIGSSAFEGCTSLETVDAESIRELGTGAFAGCSSLKKVSFIQFSTGYYGNDVYASKIASNLFKDCTSLKELYFEVPENVFNGNNKFIVDAGAFTNCPDHMTIHFFGGSDQWANKTVNSGNEPLETANIIYEGSAQSISIDKTSYSVGVGGSITIGHSKTPGSYSEDYLIWESNRPEIAYVDKNGVVTGISEGTATITLSVPNSTLIKSCTVKVGAVHAEGISIAPAADTVSVGNTVDLDPVFEPENAVNKRVTWKSSDTGIATVDSNGVVTGVSVGTVTITVTAEDGGFTAFKTMTVINPVTGITMTTTELRVAVGDTGKIQASVVPENAGNKTILWSSDNESIASVNDEGIVTGTTAGTAVITATTEDGGYTAQCTVTVYTVHAEGITVDDEASPSEIEFGSASAVVITFEPLNTTNKGLTWKSSDTSIATVDENGVVTAVGEGHVTITATSEDGGFTASKEIEIIYHHVQSIAFAEETVELPEEAVSQLQVLFTPENASNKAVTYSSDHEEIVTVDSEGRITGVKEGSALITAVTEDGNKTAQCSVTVLMKDIIIRNLESSYEFTSTAIKPEIEVYDNGTLLTPKTDYTITYKNNTKAYTLTEDDPEFSAKKAPQIILKSNSKGNYKGSKTVYFAIDPIELSDESITVDALTVQETGKILSPVPVVYFNGKKLKAKTDYIVDYTGWDRLTGDENNEAVITVIGKENGNFSGERKVTVYVAPKGTTVPVSKLKVTAATLKYEDLTEENFTEKVADAITVKDGKTDLQEGYNYTIKDIKPEDRAVGSFKVTLVGDGSEYIGERTVTVKITGIALTDKKVKALTGLSYPYTGEEITFTPAAHLVSYNGKDLTEGTDYVIDSYTKNLNAGTATVTLKGINNYTGTKKVTFKITPVIYEEGNPEFDIDVNDAVYCKGGTIPEVHVFWNGTELNAGTDYTLKCADNKKVTDESVSKWPTVTITFKGNYKGTVRRDFFIDPKPLDLVTITAKDKVYSAKANSWKSAPVLKDTDGKTLKAGTDYDKNITYTTEDGDELPAEVEPGTVIKVTVTGKGSYTGTAEVFYHILETGKDISKATFKITNKEYTGSEVTLTAADITATINKTTPLEL
ncbi:MAG: leucine-rich repeat protein, partial [Solobacterium sp.]|nr:leucine-rich repeat protein [Solobacterium sp.]